MSEIESQNVCTACGYNMIGPRPDACPFCGAAHARFLVDVDCARAHRVTGFPISERVTRFNSVPRLGIEHAAYRVDTGTGIYLIDCPSAFSEKLPRVDVIAFTHKDFLGAANQYRRAQGAELWIHAKDAEHPLAQPFPFDRRFESDFEENGLAAKFIGGHSAGFTVYQAADMLFPCDLVFDVGARTRFNPFGGGAKASREAARDLCAWLDGRAIDSVCAWNYVTDYAEWKARLDALVEHGRPVDHSPDAERDADTRRYLCERCALVYDPLLGLPDESIAPGTPFAAIPDDWRCPDCQVTKADFIPLDCDP